MAMEGMNVDAVRHISHDLKAQAGLLSGISSRVDGFIERTQNQWRGADATEFQSWWRNQHRAKVTQLVKDLDGLAQSLSNNADEQERASSGDGDSGGSSGTADSGGTPAPSSKGGQGPTPATTSESSLESAAMEAFVAKYKDTKIDFDGKYGAQCFDVFQKYSHTVAGVPKGVDIATGSDHACDIYKKFTSNGVSNYYDRIPYGQMPQPGDIVVYDSTPTNSYGHVALVTGVNGNGTGYSVLEQNYYDKDLNPNFEGLVPAAIHDKTFNSGILGYLRPKNPSASV